LLAPEGHVVPLPPALRQSVGGLAFEGKRITPPLRQPLADGLHFSIRRRRCMLNCSTSASGWRKASAMRWPWNARPPTV